MSQSEKAEYYRRLKEAGVQFDRHYREYSTEELKAGCAKLEAAAPAPEPAAAEPEFDPAATAEAFAALSQPEQPRAATVQQRTEEEIRQANTLAQSQPSPPVREADPNEMPGVRQNTHALDEPIRTDDQGRIWYQEEVRKPAFPKPRGRRVLKYMDTGVKRQQATDGKYLEEFEVAGDLPSRPAEVKITLPSYQVGIFKDKRFPFRIHTYNGRQGFDLFEVQNYYGGSELVPAEIKRVYVENVLCYDIRTTVRAIQTEYRQLQLQNRV